MTMRSWLGQVTTGHGAMVLAPTLLAVAGGQMTWQQATPLLAVGAVGLLWPENVAAQTAAKDVATDAVALGNAFMAGHAQGAAGKPGA